MSYSAHDYWRAYCVAAGLSKELAKIVVRECSNRGTFSDIDYRIKTARELSKRAP